MLGDLETTRFLLLGVAGAVLNPGCVCVDVPLVATRLDGPVRIVPSLPARLTALREDATDRLR